MLELISHPVCPFVHRTSAFLTHHGVPYTTKHIDLQAKPDWFLAISPRGKVPVLVVDGTPIFESAVILEYLAETQAPHLVSADPLERARQRMWVELSNDLLAAQYRIAVAATPALRATAIEAARDTLGRFEAELVGPYFSGEQLDLVDFATGPALLRFERLDRIIGIDLFAGLPRVAAWSRRLAERPAFRDTLVADFDERFRKVVVDHGTRAA